MTIEEGQTKNFIYTTDPHLLVKVENKKTGKTEVSGKKHFLSEYTHGYWNHFNDKINFEDKNSSVASIFSIDADPPDNSQDSNDVGLIVTHFILSVLLTVANALPA